MLTVEAQIQFQKGTRTLSTGLGNIHVEFWLSDLLCASYAGGDVQRDQHH